MGFEWIPSKKYKRHFICLECQKGFKRPPIEDMKNPANKDFSNLMQEYYDSNTKEDILQYIHTAYEKTKVVCPNCQNKMQQVSYDFEVPPHRDKKAWKKIVSDITARTTIPYKSFIQWHRIQLEKKNSFENKLLLENLTKLELVMMR